MGAVARAESRGLEGALEAAARAATAAVRAARVVELVQANRMATIRHRPRSGRDSPCVRQRGVRRARGEGEFGSRCVRVVVAEWTGTIDEFILAYAVSRKLDVVRKAG